MRLLRQMSIGVTSSVVAVAVLPWFAAPASAAAPCPDAEVVFARGTTEAPGVGPIGEAFVDAVRARVGAKSLGVYGVDYPATLEFSTAVQGIADARAHVMATVATCPDTKLVLAGFSQGAAVIGFVTANEVPDGVAAADVPTPMPAEVADHVAAVVLFGKPSTRFMRAINDPDVVVGTTYAAKALVLCVDNDLVCDPHGKSFSAHNQYAEEGLVDQGATFAVQRLQAAWAADAPAAPGGSVPAGDAAPHLGATPPLPGPATLLAPVPLSDQS